MQGDPPDDVAEARERVLDRLRSAVKESGAVNWVQFQAAVEGNTYKV